MARAFFAEVGVVRLVARRRQPQAALTVEHRVVVVGLAVPDVFVAPIGRALQDVDRAGVAGAECQRHVGCRRQHKIRRDVFHRVEDRHVVAGVLALTVERAVSVDRRITFVAGDQVMQILFRVVPVAQRDDDVALHTLRPRRRCPRQLALGDAFGPVGEIRERHAAQLARGEQDHVLAGLSGLDAADPCFLVRAALEVVCRNRAGRQLAELVAADAAVVFHHVEIIGELDVLRCFFAAEHLGLGDFHHRVPIDRRVIARGGRCVRRGHGSQVKQLAGRALHLRRIDEAVAAHPHVIIGFRQIGDDIAALIVGDDDADETHRQIARFRDHPDAGLRPLRTGDHAADVVVVNGNRSRLLRLQ